MEVVRSSGGGTWVVRWWYGGGMVVAREWHGGGTGRFGGGTGSVCDCYVIAM